MDIERHTAKGRIEKAVTLPYLRYVPHDFWEQPDAQYPLLLWLHDAEWRGRDTAELQASPELRWLREESDLPAIVLAPHCPPYDDWDIQHDALRHLLTDPVALRGVDPDRMWLIGVGMGSAGALRLAYHQPDDFAALVLVRGMGEPAFIQQLGHVPLWIFHGLLDQGASVEQAQALYAAHGHGRLTTYSLSAQELWAEMILRTDLLDWLQAQSRRRTQP